jgi:hypothetical protein
VIYGKNLGAEPALDERLAAIEDMVLRTVLKTRGQDASQRSGA